MKLIGITGGIGSGKTTVCKIFETLGVPIFCADVEAKKLMQADDRVRNEIIQAFGDDAYNEQRLNRGFLARIVFNNEIQLDRLNAIVHPAVKRATMKWVDDNQDSAYGLKEAAILFESGSYKHVAAVINVWAPLATRVERVMRRDKVDRESVMARVSKQISEPLRLSLSDYVIKNDGEQLLLPQVMRIHHLL